MNMKKAIAILLLLTAPVFVCAQSFAEKRGNKMFDRMAYAKAADYYLRAAGKKGNDRVYERLGDCYRLMGQQRNSETWYARVATGTSPTPSSFLHYAEALRANGKYAESENWMAKYNALAAGDVRAKRYVDNAGFAGKITAQEPYFEVRSLDVNTEQADFGAAFYNNQVIFASSRIDKVSVQHVHTWNEMPFLNLYVANRDANGNLDDAQPLNKKLNTKYHEGPACFSADGKTLYFTRNNYFRKKFGKDSQGINNLKIFRAVLSGSEWKEENLSINSDEYSVGHPALSADGKTLYFVSDMPGGKGATDIYRASVNADGSLGAPENLGDAINTEGKEMFPFIDAEGNLFFSSEGQVGLGGLDVFYAPANHAGGFGQIINSGLPVNSSSDDFAFVLDAAGTSGYFSSNREGGKGDDDIYAVNLLRKLKTTRIVKGIVKDKATGLPLAGAEVILKDENGNTVATVIAGPNGDYVLETDPGKNYTVAGAKPEYFNGSLSIAASNNAPEINGDLPLEKDPGLCFLFVTKDKETGAPIEGVRIKIKNNATGLTDSVLTNAGGELRFPIAGGQRGTKMDYTVSFEKTGYLAKSVPYTTEANPGGEIRMETTLDKISVGQDLAKIIDIKPIYFDLGKSVIRPDAAIELDKIVKVMNENPTMVIELGSHTDCRGTAAANLSLSDRRAKASAEYIRKRITNPSRISGKGYGETVLVNNCGCEGGTVSTCSESEHQLNRRTEFKIIKM
jgi:outer membrane protein OmpA-like peptidoglycan-associated protein